MKALSHESLAVAPPDLWPSLFKTAFMLCIVLIILVGFLFLLKKYLNHQAGGGGRGHIKMLASHHLSQKERIVLVDVLGEKILIGVTAQGISCLSKIEGHGLLDANNERNAESG